MLNFIFFLVLWLLFNGRLTPDVVGVGIVLSAAVTVFAVKICGWSEARSRRVLRLSGPLLVYFGTLFIEIIKANLAVMKVILSPGCRAAHPQIISFDSYLRRGFTQTIFANSITITPGTYTIQNADGVMTIHALNTEFADGEPGNNLNRLLNALEEKANAIDMPHPQPGAEPLRQAAERSMDVPESGREKS